VISRAFVLPIAAFALLSLAGCKKKPKPFPPPPPLVPTTSTATTEGASLGPDAGIVPVRVAVATPSSLPAPADTMSPVDRKAFEESKATVRDLDAMAKAGSLTNPDKPEDGDANMKCQNLEATRAQLEALPDPDVKQVVADERRLCSLEIPIISADKTLKQVTISPSQASRQLMCKYAAKDIDKARKEKPSDRRVRDLEARFAKACR
jgi:hypothetical protein